MAVGIHWNHARRYPEINSSTQLYAAKADGHPSKQTTGSGQDSVYYRPICHSIPLAVFHVAACHHPCPPLQQ